MQLIDPPPVSPFDATPFATYTTEEYTTPTEAELVEELPLELLPEGQELPVPPAEKPLRRGTGYLRAESAPEGPAQDDKSLEESDFGAGLDDTTPTESPAAQTGAAIPKSTNDAIAAASDTSVIDANLKSDSPRDEPNKRRRKRSRRRGAKGRPGAPTESDASPAAQSVTSNTADVTASNTTEASASTSSSPESDASTDKAKPAGQGRKRRGRKRRRRGKGTGGSSGDAQAPS